MAIPLSNIQHQIANLFHSTKGDRVIRLNIQDFLDDSDSDSYETTKHYVCSCPYCVEHFGYTKKKLYIEKDSLNQGFCQHCHSIYFNYTTDLTFDVIGFSNKYKEFQLSKLAQTKVDGSHYSLEDYTKAVKDVPGMLNLLSERNIEHITHIGEDIIMERNIERYSALIDTLGMKGCQLENGNGFIMFPFYIGSELVYWQAKIFGGDLKYFMPPIGHKPFYVPQYRGNKIVIVEGIFDAIACLTLFPDRTPIAILGSYVTDYHIWLLRNYIQPIDCLIMLDNISLSMNVYYQMKGLIPTITNYNCYYGKWDQDPDELLTSMNKRETEEFINTHRYDNTFEWK